MSPLACWIMLLGCIIIGVVLMLIGCSVSFHNDHRTIRKVDILTTPPLADFHSSVNSDSRPLLLNMTLCRGKCDEEDCKTYISPVGVCFSSGALFPNDPSWSDGWDVFDEIRASNTTLHRTIFQTTNNTCGGEDDPSDDSFDIPLGVCVGPFGQPRPWGSFQLVESPSAATKAPRSKSDSLRLSR